MAGVPFAVRFGLDATDNKLINVANPFEWFDPKGAKDGVPRDWILNNANWTKLAGRVGDLPIDTATDPIRDGTTCLIKYRFGGDDLSRLAIWDSSRVQTGGLLRIKVEVPPAQIANVQAEAALGNSYPGEVFTGGAGNGVFTVTPNADGTVTATPTTAGNGYKFGESFVRGGFGTITGLTFVLEELAGVSATGGWRFVDAESWLKDTQAEVDVSTDRVEGDFQSTTELNHKELKIFENGAWVTLFSEDDIKAWIASLSLFEGTTKEQGGTAIGAVEFHLLPDLSEETRLKRLGQISHYWTFVGAPNTEIFDEYNLVGLTGGVPGTYQITTTLGTTATVRVLSATTGKVGIHDFAIGTANTDVLNIAAGDLGAGSSAATFTVVDTNKPPTPIIGTDLAGAIFNPGDWVQISNRGTAAAPDLRWVTIGGDLLAKARADRLFSLQQWVAGGWEKGALVTDKGTIYRAKQGISSTDVRPGAGAAKAQIDSVVITPPTGAGEIYTVTVSGHSATYTTVAGDSAEDVRNALLAAMMLVPDILRRATPTPGAGAGDLSLTAATPGVGFVTTVTANMTPSATQVNVPATTNPWEKVELSGGIRWVQTDGDLPTNAPPGEVYFVLASATYGMGGGALIYWDGGANKWQTLGGGGGGLPLDLSAGNLLVSVGLPIGSITMWPTAVAPKGWFLCDGSTFNGADFPELAAVLGNTTLPNMMGQFVRGWSRDASVDAEGPRVPQSKQGDATALPKNPFQYDNKPLHNTNIQSAWSAGKGVFSTYHGGLMPLGGGDAETRPKNIAMAYIIKALDRAITVRN